MSFWDFLKDNAGGIGQILGLAGGGLLTNEAYQNLGDVGKLAYDRSQQLAQQGLEQTQFKPFTVTTGFGGVTSTPEGGYTMNLSPQQQALQNQLMQQSQGFYNQASQPLAERQQALYNQMRAMQTPEEQRAALALENRLAQQGRLGVRTNQFGGTPEQLALAKAQEEAKNQAWLSAMQQSQAEQRQQAELGNLYMSAGYTPQQRMLEAYGPGLQGAQLASDMQRSGAGLFGEAQMGGLNALLGARIGQSNLMGELGKALIGGSMTGMIAPMLSPTTSTGGSAIGNLVSSAGSAIGGLFGGGNNRISSSLPRDISNLSGGALIGSLTRNSIPDLIKNFGGTPTQVSNGFNTTVANNSFSRSPITNNFDIQNPFANWNPFE